MYEYTDGIKKKNVGYARVETRNGECRFKIYMQADGLAEGIFPTYLIHRPAGAMDLIYIGDSVVKNQVLDGRLTVNENNVMDSGLKFSDMGGILLFQNSGVFYATLWDDKPIVLDEVLRALKPGSEKVPTAAGRKQADNLQAADAYKNADEKEKAFADGKGGTEGKTFPGKEADEKEKAIAGVKEEAKEKTSSDEKGEREEKTAAKKQADTEGLTFDDHKEDDEKKVYIDKKAPTEGITMADGQAGTEKIAAVYTDNKAGSDSKPDSETGKAGSQVPLYMLPRGYKIRERINPVRYEKPINPWEQVDKFRRFETEKMNASDREPKDISQPAADEVQKENQTVEKIFNNYPRIYPFEDNEIKRCVKIEPKDIGTLPSGAWILSNNSFLLHGYYCYHHLIFAEITDRYGCRYIIGVPGIYHNRERFMARMFGFENFKSIRKRDLKQGDFGYWYQEVRL